MSPRYCVIGAGPCGLAALKTLRQHGLEAECLEQQDDLGGNWYYGSPHSPMYASATMISSKRMTEFPDFRMPLGYAHYPGHEQALAYLRSYAERFRLLDHMHFNTPVQTVRRDVASGRGWLVSCQGELQPRVYDGVIVASGHHAQPRWPEGLESFAGTILHSRDYRRPDAFRGQRVLVIGAGNSGCDIAAEVGRHAQATLISVRRGYHFLPKFLCGAPVDRCGETMAKYRLPWWVYRLITAALLRVSVGPLQRYGLPTPDHRLFESHPIVNSQLLQALGHGRVAVKPAIASVGKDGVEFVDGSYEPLDVIICATGFAVSWPFLEPNTLREAGELNTGNLHLRLFERRFDGLFFVGLIQPNGGIWALADGQSQLVAKYLLARQRSRQVARKLERVFSRVPRTAMTGGLHYLESPRHAFEVEYFAYRRLLQRMLSQCDRLGLRPVVPDPSAEVAEVDGASAEQSTGAYS